MGNALFGRSVSFHADAAAPTNTPKKAISSHIIPQQAGRQTGAKISQIE